MNKQKEAQRLLAIDKPAFLVTVGEGGRPDTRAMAVVKTEGLRTIWMISGKNSDKYKELSKNPDCMIYATDLVDTANYLELRLWGKIDILTDDKSKALAWHDGYTCYFPEGKEDPNLCILKFTADCGTLQTQAGKEKILF